MFHASRFTRHVSRLAVLAALVFGVMYFLVAIPRVFYPYDLDFLEDSMLMQSLRIANGQPIYVPPNADFVPHVYMPLYAWLGGLLLKITGPSFAPLRLLSLAATIATAVLIYAIAQRESGLRWIGFTCAGLFLGGYRISGFWYELVRVDSLFVTLALAGLLLGVYGDRSNKWLILLAGVCALAFWTKQTGLIFAVGLTIYLLFTVGRRAWLFVSMFGALAIMPIVVLNAFTEGWFAYYAFGVASSNSIEIARLVDYVRFELFGLMAGLSVMALAASALGLRRAGVGVIRDQPWLIGIAAAVLISGAGRASVGGNQNNLMPAYALLCLAPAILMREWSISRRTEDESHTADDPIRHAPLPSRLPSNVDHWHVGLIAAAIVIQFAIGHYNPLRQFPRPDLRQSGDRLIERIASFDGEVLVMMHPYYAWLAGKQPSAQIATMWHTRERGQLPLPADFARRIQNRHYAAIISDETLFETDPALAELLNANYVRGAELTEFDAPPVLTGMFARPQVVYVPRR